MSRFKKEFLNTSILPPLVASTKYGKVQDRPKLCILVCDTLTCPSLQRPSLAVLVPSTVLSKKELFIDKYPSFPDTEKKLSSTV